MIALNTKYAITLMMDTEKYALDPQCGTPSHALASKGSVSVPSETGSLATWLPVSSSDKMYEIQLYIHDAPEEIRLELAVRFFNYILAVKRLAYPDREVGLALVWGRRVLDAVGLKEYPLDQFVADNYALKDGILYE